MGAKIFSLKALYTVKAKDQIQSQLDSACLDSVACIVLAAGKSGPDLVAGKSGPDLAHI